MVSAPERVRCTSFCKARGTQPATIATVARSAVGPRIVAAVCEPVVETQRQSQSDDVGLRQLDQRRVNGQRAALDAGPSGKAGQLLEGADEFGTAIGIPGVV